MGSINWHFPCGHVFEHRAQGQGPHYNIQAQAGDRCPACWYNGQPGPAANVQQPSQPLSYWGDERARIYGLIHQLGPEESARRGLRTEMDNCTIKMAGILARTEKHHRLASVADGIDGTVQAFVTIREAARIKLAREIANPHPNGLGVDALRAQLAAWDEVVRDWHLGQAQYTPEMREAMKVPEERIMSAMEEASTLLAFWTAE